MTIEQRNAFYKGMLAARKGVALSVAPATYNIECLTMWIAGHNQENEQLSVKKAEMALMASML